MPKQRHTTLLRGIIVPILSVMILQTGLVYGAIVLGGSVSQLESNAFSILGERVAGRASNLETSMVQNWSNVNSTQATLEELVNSCRIEVLDENGRRIPDSRG